MPEFTAASSLGKRLILECDFRSARIFTNARLNFILRIVFSRSTAPLSSMRGGMCRANSFDHS